MRPILTLLSIVVLFIGYMVDEDATVRAVEKQGFSEVKITGRHEISPKSVLASPSGGHRQDQPKIFTRFVDYPCQQKRLDDEASSTRI